MANTKHYDCAPSLIYFIHILLRYYIKDNCYIVVLLVLLEGARASMGLSLLCVDVGYNTRWCNVRPLCA